jgi:hypothetical protein
MVPQSNRKPDRGKSERRLIDTNVWSSVADTNLEFELAKAAKWKHVDILAPPGVL